MDQPDIDDLRRRILAIERGELPASAVTVEELRAVVEHRRTRVRPGLVASATEPSGFAKSTRAKPAAIDLGDLGF